MFLKKVHQNQSADIYSDVKFIGEGQTIYVRGGVYNLKSPIIIERGNDSKSNNPKILSAYPNGHRIT